MPEAAEAGDAWQAVMQTAMKTRRRLPNVKQRPGAGQGERRQRPPYPQQRGLGELLRHCRQRLLQEEAVGAKGLLHRPPAYIATTDPPARQGGSAAAARDARCRHSLPPVQARSRPAGLSSCPADLTPSRRQCCLAPGNLPDHSIAAKQHRQMVLQQETAGRPRYRQTLVALTLCSKHEQRDRGRWAMFRHGSLLTAASS